VVSLDRGSALHFQSLRGCINVMCRLGVHLQLQVEEDDFNISAPHM